MWTPLGSLGLKRGDEMARGIDYNWVEIGRDLAKALTATRLPTPGLCR